MNVLYYEPKIYIQYKMHINAFSKYHVKIKLSLVLTGTTDNICFTISNLNKIYHFPCFYLWLVFIIDSEEL